MMKENNFEIKLPEHALGNYFAQKATAEVYTQYAEYFGEEKAQEIFQKTWEILAEVDKLEAEGRVAEADELEDELDEYMEDIMDKIDMIESMEDSEYD